MLSEGRRRGNLSQLFINMTFTSLLLYLFTVIKLNNLNKSYISLTLAIITNMQRNKTNFSIKVIRESIKYIKMTMTQILRLSLFQANIQNLHVHTQ